MTNENNPIYERNTLEFVTVALEYCGFVEKAGEKGLFDFVDKATKGHYLFSYEKLFKIGGDST